MTDIKLPGLTRSICAKLQTYGRSTKLGPNVYKLGRERNLAQILTTRGWRVVKETKDYLYAEAPKDTPVDEALTIEIAVPTGQQVRDLAGRVYAADPERPWAARWGEWLAVYFPKERYSVQESNPFTGEQGEVRHEGWIPAHFDVGAHGLFMAGVDDVGGEDRYFESVEFAPVPAPSLFAGQASPSNADVGTASGFVEGGALQVELTRYERSTAARRVCIAHWGTRCYVCGFDFEVAYGELGAGYIQVHHLVPVADIGEEYEVDPVNDLRAICPNCHAMIHRQEPPRTIEELQGIVNRSRA